MRRTRKDKGIDWRHDNMSVSTVSKRLIESLGYSCRKTSSLVFMKPRQRVEGGVKKEVDEPS